jgi:hypothetical protein
VEPPAESVLTVRNDTLFALIPETEPYLQQARSYLQQNKAAAAGHALETVVAFVRLEMARSTDPARDKLLDAAIALDRLAGDTDKPSVALGRFAEVSRLVHMALAAHNRQMAQATWAEKAWQVTGQHLYGSELHIRQGLAWADQTLTDKQQALLKENTVLAKALMDGPGCGNDWAEKAVAPQIVAMGNLVGALLPAQ